MHRAAIIYAPQDSAIAALAAELEHAFDRGRYVAGLVEAGAARIPDLAAADIVLLGSLPDGRAPLAPAFSELIRSLEGVNLAGRVAGVFSIGSPRTLESLRRALQSSDVVMAGEDLLLEPTKNNHHGEKVRSWVRLLCRLYESRNGGTN